MTGEIIARFIAKREALIAEAAPGTGAARALADLTDEVVSALAEASSAGVGDAGGAGASGAGGAKTSAAGVAAAGRARTSGTPFALLALGGYGARRLLPHSDIDLLVVVDPGRRDSASLVREVLYPLWDTGLQVGHQVRTPKDQARAVAEDLETLTSFLTARFVAGDASLAEAAVSVTFSTIARRARRTELQLGSRERPGSPYLLEPDLKSGAGGQRDIDELVWRCALEAGTPVADCTRLPLLEGTEMAVVAEAQDAITAARWLVHRASPRAENRLSAAEARDLGGDTDRLQRALETVHATLLAVRDRVAGTRSREVPISSIADLERLATAPGAVDALETAARTGALDGAVPGFSQLMTLRRPALSHRYTVGAHSLRVLALAARSARDLPPGQRHPLLVAALVHDVGKRDSLPGHPVRGAEEARRAARLFGLEEPTARAAAMLVREHLLLSEVATTRDLADEDVVLAAAARLGDGELVAPLFALTEADMRATGPEVWTPWRAALVSELAAKLDAALGPDVDGAGIVAQAEATRQEALRLAAAEGASRRVLSFLEHAPLRYLARRSAADTVRDARLVQSLAGPGLPGEVSLRIGPGPVAGSWTLDVVTRDRPGLFAIVSGCLALVGLDTLSAEAVTEAGGIALDTFAVASATLAPVEPSTWSAFERALHAAFRDPSGLEARLAERRRHYQGNATGPYAVDVSHAGPFTTGVRVRVPDRVGLLHDLARAIERCGFDIRRATVTTAAGRAEDVFELVDEAADAPPQERVREQLFPLLLDASRG